MSVSTLVLVGLAVIWAVVLLPEVWKRWNRSRGDSIRSFSHQLASLQRPTGGSGQAESGRGAIVRSNVIDLRRGGAAAPARRPAAVSPAVRRRRQEVLASLAAAAVLTLLCAVAFGGLFLVLHLIADVLLVGYVYLLVQAQNAPAQRPVRTGVHSSGLQAVPLPATGTDGALGRVTPLSARGGVR